MVRDNLEVGTSESGVGFKSSEGLSVLLWPTATI